MKMFLCNSSTLHVLLLNLGIKFMLEEHKPYRICNYQYGISFLPCDESLPYGRILMVKNVEWVTFGVGIPIFKRIVDSPDNARNLIDFFGLFAFRP